MSLGRSGPGRFGWTPETYPTCGPLHWSKGLVTKHFTGSVWGGGGGGGGGATKWDGGGGL